MAKSKKTVLHVIPSLVVGGAEKLLLETIHLFPELEHHVVAFEADPDFLKCFEKVAVVHLKKSGYFLSLSNVLFIKRLEKQLKPFIIHAHLLKANWLCRFAFFNKRNLYNSIHSPYSKDAFCHHAYTVWVEKYTYFLSQAHLVFVSEDVRNDYAAYIPLKGRNSVLENFISDDFFDLNIKKYNPGSPLRLVAIGNIKSLKNYGFLIEVFKQLKSYPVSLDVYGSGHLLNRYREEVITHDLKIDFKGGTNSVEDVLSGYHGLLFPSLYEGLSLALLEAMAAGMPLVLSNIPMFQKLTRGNAYFFDPQDTSQCIQAILALYHKGFTEKALAENKSYVQEHYNASVYKRNLKALYPLF